MVPDPTSHPERGELRLAPSTVVLLRSDGIFLPRADDAVANRLAPAAVAALAGLSAGDVASREAFLAYAGSVGGDAEEDRAALHGTWEALVTRGLLRNGPDDLGAPPLEVTPDWYGTEPAIDDVDVDGPTVEAPLDEPLEVMCLPLYLLVRGGGFEWWDHQGVCRIRLSPVGLMVALGLARPRPASEAIAEMVSASAAMGLTFDEVASTLQRLRNARLVSRFDPTDPEHRVASELVEQSRQRMRSGMRIERAYAGVIAAHERDEAARRDRGLSDRVQVVGVVQSRSVLPLGLGMLLANATNGPRDFSDHYVFHPRIWFKEAGVRDAARRGGIFLFSDYLWSSAAHLGLSAIVKSTNPATVNVHGGPDAPKYTDDLERWFHDHPDVDVVVHGEGETTFLDLLDALRVWDGKGPADLSVLADVPGLSYRTEAGFVRSGPRDRIAELDSLPSPYLTGWFDIIGMGGEQAMAIIETNRGCPYGCTFCDWGSATNSRIRQFSLERVYEELQWCAEHRIYRVFMADANYGIFERDVAIAQRFAELKKEYGFPKTVTTNYAKNTVKYLTAIIETFADAGILTEGKLALQSMDQPTLTTIRRKNIRTEKYNDMAAEFSANGLPLAVELMMGLPGSTLDSFRRDLQESINRNVRGFVYPTVLLPNAPMNDPDYRRENGIVARPGEVLRETATYTESDWQHMSRLADIYTTGDFFGAFRHVSLHVRAVAAMSEVDFYERVVEIVDAHRDRLPLLDVVLRSLPHTRLTPVSWALFIADLRVLLVEHLGLPDDAVLDTVLAVQHAHLPARDRHYPTTLELAHDYGAWYRQMEEARQSAHRTDWEQVVPKLSTFPPATMVIDDSLGRTAQANWEISINSGGTDWYHWEFESPVSRIGRVAPALGVPEAEGPVLAGG
ncbi:MAG: radical SAM protein [Acidimicrobiia bacterium]|nr:radical SAM protein [Acidimicrobiia bacterium]